MRGGERVVVKGACKRKWELYRSHLARFVGNGKSAEILFLGTHSVFKKISHGQSRALKSDAKAGTDVQARNLLTRKNSPDDSEKTGGKHPSQSPP